MKHPLIYGFIVFICGALSGASLMSYYARVDAITSTVREVLTDSPRKSDAGSAQHKNLLLVGDVMLARTVESRMRDDGVGYPFSAIGDFLRSHSAVVGNFEGSIPRVHTQTPPMNFQFSIAPEYAQTLKEYGFTHLGLANNHSYDFGAEDFHNTTEVLREQGYAVGGDPEKLATTSIMFARVDGLIVAIVPVYAVLHAPDADALATTLTYAESVSDRQIVYVHWGEEYQLGHTKEQEALAHTSIDLGADAVVGHHPHVVADVATYSGAPIFYSLGNFIFDQYWNDEVQTGLALQVTRSGEGMQFTMVPLRSVDSVPARMTEEETTQFLQALALRSDPVVADAIARGVLGASDLLLATSGK